MYSAVRHVELGWTLFQFRDYKAPTAGTETIEAHISQEELSCLKGECEND